MIDEMKKKISILLISLTEGGPQKDIIERLSMIDISALKD